MRDSAPHRTRRHTTGPVFRLSAPVSAAVLMVLLVYGLVLGCALIGTSVVTTSDVVSDEIFSRLALASIPVAGLVGTLIARHQSVEIDDSKAVLTYTRFGVPQRFEASLSAINRVVLVRGLVSLDGYPRPRLEFTLEDASLHRVSLALYTFKDGPRILDELARRGVRVETMH